MASAHATYYHMPRTPMNLTAVRPTPLTPRGSCPAPWAAGARGADPTRTTKAGPPPHTKPPSTTPLLLRGAYAPASLPAHAVGLHFHLPYHYYYLLALLVLCSPRPPPTSRELSSTAGSRRAGCPSRTTLSLGSLRTSRSTRLSTWGGEGTKLIEGTKLKTDRGSLRLK